MPRLRQQVPFHREPSACLPAVTVASDGDRRTVGEEGGVTFLPLDARNVTGVGGPDYELGGVCCHPECVRTDELEQHHLWRRSFLGGPFWRVRLPDGCVVGNVVELCREHHRTVTENKARISWDGDGFVWGDVGVLAPQPPLNAALANRPMTPSDGQAERSVEREDVCPKCKGKGRLPHRHDEEAVRPQRTDTKAARTKSISIPEWARSNGEDGAALLGELFDIAADILAAMHEADPDRVPKPKPKQKGRDYDVVSLVFGQWVQENREWLRQKEAA